MSEQEKVLPLGHKFVPRFIEREACAVLVSKGKGLIGMCDMPEATHLPAEAAPAAQEQMKCFTEEQLEARDAAIRRESGQEIARLDPVCWTCGGGPSASTRVCVCGGTGMHVDEVQGLREAGLKAQESKALVQELHEQVKNLTIERDDARKTFSELHGLEPGVWACGCRHRIVDSHGVRELLHDEANPECDEHAQMWALVQFLQSWVGDEMARSDFKTAADMRAALQRERALVQELLGVLKEAKKALMFVSYNLHVHPSDASRSLGEDIETAIAAAEGRSK